MDSGDLAARGPLPDGKCVIFRDRNKLRADSERFDAVNLASMEPPKFNEGSGDRLLLLLPLVLLVVLFFV